MIRTLGHLAFWPMLYSVGVLVLTLELLDADPIDWRAYLFVAICAHSCYLLDRIKVSDARLDPADTEAQPDRYRFLTTHAKALRRVVVFELFIATAIAAISSLPLIAVPLIGAICVHLYAGRPAAPEHPRIKDLPAFKGILIAASHIALAGATLASFSGSIHPLVESDAVVSLLSVATIVFADAILCDLDDLRADRAFATKSVPVIIGQRSAWILAFAAHLGAGIGLIIVQSASAGVLVFVGCLLVSDLVFLFFERQRDWVDARLLVLTLLLTAIG